MKISIGCDHAAFNEKEHLKAWLKEEYEICDEGTYSLERCDYPDFVKKVVSRVIQEKRLGILICGSGIGVSMAANRFAGIRGALCRSSKEAELSRQHNDANILCLGARINSLDEMKMIIETWLQAEFEHGRHSDRIGKFNNLGTSL